MPWSLEKKLQERLHVNLNVSKNLIRLIDKEENTPTFVARYRSKDTGNMTPEEVFTAAKTIQELKEVQKKSNALIENLQKENKLTKPLKLEISSIDNLEDLNETIKIHKTKKSSALQKAIESGAETALEQGRKSVVLLIFDYYILNYLPF